MPLFICLVFFSLSLSQFLCLFLPLKELPSGHHKGRTIGCMGTFRHHKGRTIGCMGTFRHHKGRTIGCMGTFRAMLLQASQLAILFMSWIFLATASASTTAEPSFMPRELTRCSEVSMDRIWPVTLRSRKYWKKKKLHLNNIVKEQTVHTFLWIGQTNIQVSMFIRQTEMCQY